MITEYHFPNDPSQTGYCLFPAKLEDDKLVFFHATLDSKRQLIITGGFQIPDPTGAAGLPSISFAKRSVDALTWGIKKRGTSAIDICIFAVRYETVDRQGLQVNVSDMHDYTLMPQPTIIGYCIVPKSYQHK